MSLSITGLHSADSSNKFPDLHTTQTLASEVRWGALSGHQHVCISYSQERIKRQLKETSNGRISQINHYLSYKPHSSFRPTWIFFEDVVCVLQMVPLTKNRCWYWYKDRKSTRDKANIGNPKVNRDCPPLTGNRTSADCVENSLGPSVQYIPMGSTILGVSTLRVT